MRIVFLIFVLFAVSCAQVPLTISRDYGEGERLYKNLLQAPNTYADYSEYALWDLCQQEFLHWKEKFLKTSNYAEWEAFRSTMLRRYGPLPNGRNLLLERSHAVNQTSSAAPRSHEFTVA